MKRRVSSLLPGKDVARVDALASQRGLTRHGMLVQLVGAGLPQEEARAPAAQAESPPDDAAARRFARLST